MDKMKKTRMRWLCHLLRIERTETVRLVKEKRKRKTEKEVEISNREGYVVSGCK